MMAKRGQFKNLRCNMVSKQLKSRGINDQKILDVFKKVPRHLFVNQDDRDKAYEDSPLPIGYDQTISQPYIVAYMKNHLNLSKTDYVLEIGTGSGYQTAVLAELAGQVFSIEIIPELANFAKQNLDKLNYWNIQVKLGDGYNGWQKNAPFDAIILTAAPAQNIPQPLLDQLKDYGKLIAPLGQDHQELLFIRKIGDQFERRRLLSVRFVPMVGITQDISKE